MAVVPVLARVLVVPVLAPVAEDKKYIKRFSV